MPENIDWAFIAALEGSRVLRGYVPDANRSNSGVTIATGFDLGQRNRSDLTVLGLPAALITKFAAYLGLRGVTAVNFLRTHPLTITDAEARDIDRRVRRREVPVLKERYRLSPHNTRGVAFDNLPGQAQTVIASVSFQYGNLSTAAPRFWQAASSQNWTQTVSELRSFGDAYPTRRSREANLLEQIVVRTGR